MSNNWYEIINVNTLEQGDILEQVEVVVPSTEFLKGETKEIQTETHDVLLLTQSCDMANNKTPWIQVTPIVPISVMKERFPAFRDNNNLEFIRRGYQHKYHLLHECGKEGFEREVSVLDFRNIFTLPSQHIYDFVNSGIKRRRLNSPYKEHLAQAYARFFMRVGLPNDIPPFKVTT
jgi:hypothetical protein